MELKKLTKNIYYLPHEPEVDRPMLAYVKGEKYSLAVDAGYSFCHVKDFYEAIELNKFGIPDFTVIPQVRNFNDGYMDKDKLNFLIRTIHSIDCQYCVLSHCESLEKEDLLYYLESVI